MTCSLYLHIPFCKQKCSYCDFYSVSGIREIDQLAYVEKLIKDYYKFKRLYGISEIQTIFIGGGSPSTLTLCALSLLLDFVNDMALNACEISFEANPGDLSQEKLKVLNDSCVSRLSIGIQSLNPGTLAYIGRSPQSYDDSEKILDRIALNWSKDLSADLITGVFEQDAASICHDISVLQQYGFDHLSLYGLQNEEGTGFFELVNAGLRDEIGHSAFIEQQRVYAEVLEQHGYFQYEVSNYARNKKYSQHNLAYWHMQPYLGLGSTAVSHIPYQQQLWRIKGKSLPSFFQEKDDYHFETLTAKEFLVEQFIMGLRLKNGVSSKKFLLSESQISSLLQYVNTKELLLVLEKDNLKLTEKGYSIMNPVLIQIMEYLDILMPY